jgi:hypothetical protein
MTQCDRAVPTVCFLAKHKILTHYCTSNANKQSYILLVELKCTIFIINGFLCFYVQRWQLCSSTWLDCNTRLLLHSIFLYHHHHHHFPFQYYVYWDLLQTLQNWSLHLFKRLPEFLFPFGYFRIIFGILSTCSVLQNRYVVLPHRQFPARYRQHFVNFKYIWI